MFNIHRYKYTGSEVSGSVNGYWGGRLHLHKYAI